MTKELIIKYHPDGRVEIEGLGFVDKKCLEASKPFETALGLEDITREMKPDEPIAHANVGRNRNQISS